MPAEVKSHGSLRYFLACRQVYLDRLVSVGTVGTEQHAFFAKLCRRIVGNRAVVLLSRACRYNRENTEHGWMVCVPSGNRSPLENKDRLLCLAVACYQDTSGRELLEFSSPS